MPPQYRRPSGMRVARLHLDSRQLMSRRVACRRLWPTFHCKVGAGLLVVQEALSLCS